MSEASVAAADGRPRGLAVAAFALALLVRGLVTWRQLAGGRDGLTTDGCYYIQLAKNLLAGKGFSLAGIPHTVFPPGASFAIALVNRFVPDAVWSAQIVSVVSFYAAAVLLFGILHRSLRNQAIAVLAATIYLFAYPLLSLSAQAASDTLYALLLVANLALVIDLARSESPRGVLRLSAIGAIAALMFLTRPEGLIVFAADGVVAGTLVLQRRLRLLPAIAMVVLFVLVTAPYVVFLHAATGEWRLSGKNVAWLQSESVENGTDPLVWERNSYQLTSGGRFPWIDSSVGARLGLAQYVMGHRGGLLKRVVKNAGSYARLFLIHFGLLVLLVPLAVRWSKGRLEIAYLGMLFALSFYLLLFAVTGRYWSSNLPPLVLFVAFLADRAAERSAMRRPVYAAFALALGVNAVVGWRSAAAELPRRSASREAAAAWIREHVPAAELVIARNPHVPFMGGHEWIRFPWFEDDAAFTAYMQRNRLAWFLMSDDERRLRPFLAAAEKSGALDSIATQAAAFRTEGGPIRIMRLNPDGHASEVQLRR